MKHIVSFSGGKDSTAMLLKMIENNMPIDIILFCDTGMEFPAMYDHIKKVESYIGKNVTIIKSEKSYEYYLADHIKTKGKNKGKAGYGHPDFRNRWCTSALKQQVVKRFLKSLGDEVIEYHGIALDEAHRSDKNNDGRLIKYPLIDLKMTEADCLQYCYDMGFDWSGLYEDFGRVSCWCCPLSRIGELRVLYNKYPELWGELVKLDKKSYRTFRSDYTVAELGDRFYAENNK